MWFSKEVFFERLPLNVANWLELEMQNGGCQLSGLEIMSPIPSRVVHTHSAQLFHTRMKQLFSTSWFSMIVQLSSVSDAKVHSLNSPI